ncbi:MAG: preprotein translocase subunit SecG [Prevotellaceae bacterium]|jgi:preprotein translocase subunit SecG|nr:preprotein translocase subunit SecG [Prevotellaceae bacterium]
MYLLLTIIIVIAAIVLTFVVLIQNSKGGGLAAGFASANQVFGVRKTTDRIEKFTWALIACIVVLSVFSSSFHKHSSVQATSELSTEIADAPLQSPAAQPVNPDGE